MGTLISGHCVPRKQCCPTFYEASIRQPCTKKKNKKLLGFQVVSFRCSLLQLLGKLISGELGAYGKLQPLLRQERVLWKVGIW